MLLAKLVMIAFVKVLDDVENQCAEISRSFAPLRIELVEPYAPQLESHCLGAAHAVSAYRDVQGDRTASPAPPQRNENFTQLIGEAVQSAQRLKALRRDLAWRLHPDRDPRHDGKPLAEINAAIDAALARCSSGRE